MGGEGDRERDKVWSGKCREGEGAPGCCCFTWPDGTITDRLRPTPFSLYPALQEADEARTTMARNKQFASFQLRQAEIKARRRAAEKIEEMQLAAQIQLTVREQVRRPLL